MTHMTTKDSDYEPILTTIGSLFLALGGPHKESQQRQLAGTLLDVDAGILNRAMVSFGAEAYRWLAQQLDVAPKSHVLLQVLMIAPSPVSVISAVNAAPDETGKQIYWESQEAAGSSEPLAPHVSIEMGAVSPSAVVIDSAVQSILPLIAKIASLQPFSKDPGATVSSRPFDPTEQGSQRDDGIQMVLERTRIRLGCGS